MKEEKKQTKYFHIGVVTERGPEQVRGNMRMATMYLNVLS